MKNLLCVFYLVCFLLFSCDKEDDTPDEDPPAANCASKNLSMETESTGSACGTSEGSISATVTGSTGALSYQLDEGPFQSSGSFSGLKPGIYEITAKDDDDCTVTAIVGVESGISFASTIKPLIDTNCAVSGCHVSGTGRANFTEFANIKQNAASIKSLTQSKTMPQNGSLTDTEIANIACWVDDGALDN